MQRPPGDGLWVPGGATGGLWGVDDSPNVSAALLDDTLAHNAQEKKMMNSKRRRRINCVPALMAVFLPWVLFLAAYATTSFYFHYVAPCTMCALIFFALYLGFILIVQARQKQGQKKDQFYPLYFGWALIISVGLGALWGDLNFYSYMQPAYEEEHLATYTNIDPSSERLWNGALTPTRGKRFQDAGKVYFRHDAVLDVNRSMSFKMGDLYCVAPIVNPNCRKNCGLDFWAVGINCCSEDAADFRCGQYNNKRAKSGLRFLPDSRRPYFRLAVLQAEGAHKISSPHPLFFQWVEDPVHTIREWKKDGYRRFLFFMLFSFPICVAVVFVLLRARKALPY